MTFHSHDRALLARLADALIPAGDGYPSASEAEVAGQWLDAILAARPDLIAGLARVLDKSRGREPAEAVAELRANDPAAFGVLAEFAAGAYFMNPKVRLALGYGGQSPRPIDPHPDYLDDGMLHSVIDRGPIYRPTPGGPK